MRDDERSALHREICRDEHSKRLLVWLVAYKEFSSQVWLTAYLNHSSNDSEQRATKTQPKLEVLSCLVGHRQVAYWFSVSVLVVIV